ncbi:hypothetical protein GFL58_30740 [Rhizobium leguminosarum bv. viciae]|uniref:hypothetical protein n=1 Tax=Rhizobium leguminosarum TaxID=384 RepID=UPI00143F82CB|nr:hypothetical protein [Rhizobium leguminosarum]NKM65296.1 hypothetical protein [Rhizobium leguminosarum bv. viciae]
MSENPLIANIDELLERVDTCVSYCRELGLQDAYEKDYPYLAAYMLSREEMGQIDYMVKNLCRRVRGQEPDTIEWVDHVSQLFQVWEIEGRYPRTSMEGWANAKVQLRKTKAFVRVLLAEQCYQVEMAAARTPANKQEVVLGHVIQGNAGQVIVDSEVNRSTLANTVQSLESRCDMDISEFIRALSEVVTKSGNKEAVELVDQLNEELSRTEPRKSLMRLTWDNLVAVLPVVKEVAGAAGAIAKLLA